MKNVPFLNVYKETKKMEIPLTVKKKYPPSYPSMPERNKTFMKLQKISFL
jgi:hypothetical protein